MNSKETIPAKRQKTELNDAENRFGNKLGKCPTTMQDLNVTEVTDISLKQPNSLEIDNGYTDTSQQRRAEEEKKELVREKGRH